MRPLSEDVNTLSYEVNLSSFEKGLTHEQRLLTAPALYSRPYPATGFVSAVAGHLAAVVICVSFAALAAPVIVKDPPATHVTVLSQEEWAALSSETPVLEIPQPELPQPVSLPQEVQEPAEEPLQQAEIDLPPPDLAELVVFRPPVQKVEKPVKPKPVVKKAEPQKKVAKKQEAPRESRPASTASVQGTSGAPSARHATRPPASYISSVVRKINAAKFYPTDARDNGTKGRVMVAFSIRRDGSLGGLRIVGSSGSGSLDHAARQIVAKAAPFGAFPEDVASSQIQVTAPIDFSLR